MAGEFHSLPHPNAEAFEAPSVQRSLQYSTPLINLYYELKCSQDTSIVNDLNKKKQCCFDHLKRYPPCNLQNKTATGQLFFGRRKGPFPETEEKRNGGQRPASYVS